MNSLIERNVTPRLRKAGIPTNKEAIVILSAELKKIGEQKFTLPGIVKAVALTDSIKALKQNDKLTILI